MTVHDSLAALQAENERLIALLEAHGIDWRPVTERPPSGNPPPATTTSRLSPTDKVALFQRLFRGRTDVYPLRWESSTTGKSGYSPPVLMSGVPASARNPESSAKSASTDNSCRYRIPSSYDHLAGKHTIGLYPLLEDDGCYLLAVDFDEEEWRDDIRAFARTCHELDVPVALEVSRSGQGAHAWIFFADKVPAREARRLEPH
jgi:hypothetical protein